MKRYFKTLPLEILHSALNYQRSVDKNFIKNKVENFDANEVDAPAISLRIVNGKEEYRIIDGQHTISIVECVGWRHIKCEIREGLTEEQENEWFYNRNNKRRAQTSGRMLNAKINGKFDSTTNKLIDSLDLVGYKVKTVENKGGNGVINAGLTIETMFKDMDEDEFKSCMALHSSVWLGDKKALTAPFLKGMNKFYMTYKDDIDSKRFIQAFKNKNITANDIIREVNNSMLKTNNSIKYAWVLTENYNKGLKDENKRLKFSKLGI